MKKVLLIMPNFFEYPHVICEEIKSLGYEVDFFDDRPSTSPLVKATIRINKNLIKRYIKRYFQSILEKTSKKKYDVVFLISGQSLSFSEDMMEELKKSQPHSKRVLYQWDSLKNFPYIEKMHKYFDKCYSFDKSDCDNLPYLKFLPLFYSKEYENISNLNKKNFEYDFCFVGTAHPKKYKFIKIMSKQLKLVYPKQFIYFYFPSRIVYFYRKIINKEFRKAKINEFNFVPLNSKKMVQIYTNTRCVLDSPQDGQLGLTIRVIEALGAKKKLITTNEDVLNYDFYKPENIYVYNDKINLENTFFKNDYLDIDEKIYEKYSLKNWLKEIFSI